MIWRRAVCWADCKGDYSSPDAIGSIWAARAHTRTGWARGACSQNPPAGAPSRDPHLSGYTDLPQSRASDVKRSAGRSAGNPGARWRLVVMSFHSLEDRIVKRFMQTHARAPQPGAALRYLPLRAPAEPAPALKLGPRIRARDAERKANVRARSAVMRSAEKLG